LVPVGRDRFRPDSDADGNNWLSHGMTENSPVRSSSGSFAHDVFNAFALSPAQRQNLIRLASSQPVQLGGVPTAAPQLRGPIQPRQLVTQAPVTQMTGSPAAALNARVTPLPIQAQGVYPQAGVNGNTVPVES